MAIGTRSYARGYLGSGGLPPGIKWLLISNVAVFLLNLLFLRQVRAFAELFWLRPYDVMHGYVWQLATYLFFHASVGHLFWNMVPLWMFGRDLEGAWGTRKFVRFYLFCGIGAGVCVIVAHYLTGSQNVPTVGASGAIYGLLVAAAILWPDRQVLFQFLIPIKMKYFVMITSRPTLHRSL